MEYNSDLDISREPSPCKVICSSNAMSWMTLRGMCNCIRMGFTKSCDVVFILWGMIELLLIGESKNMRLCVICIHAMSLATFPDIKCIITWTIIFIIVGKLVIWELAGLGIMMCRLIHSLQWNCNFLSSLSCWYEELLTLDAPTCLLALLGGSTRPWSWVPLPAWLDRVLWWPLRSIFVKVIGGHLGYGALQWWSVPYWPLGLLDWMWAWHVFMSIVLHPSQLPLLWN